ncbi:MAG TPA: Rrf2 family transcriptional regulator [Sphingomonadaceae bacterium]|nr:Rrf2 family transcriptional regulator [Sphingomonadaceae bacterium]
MKRDGRLSGVLHVLLHMAQRDGPSTSEQLAMAMQTNPVVVRRVMAGLRENGLVTSTKGHGGGWTIACDLDTVTLRDIYEALDRPGFFAIGNRNDHPDCLVERAVNKALNGALQEAEDLLLQRFGQVTLAMLSAEFGTGLAAHFQSPAKDAPHGHNK